MKNYFYSFGLILPLSAVFLYFHFTESPQGSGLNSEYSLLKEFKYLTIYPNQTIDLPFDVSVSSDLIIEAKAVNQNQKYAILLFSPDKLGYVARIDGKDGMQLNNIAMKSDKPWKIGVKSKDLTPLLLSISIFNKPLTQKLQPIERKNDLALEIERSFGLVSPKYEDTIHLPFMGKGAFSAIASWKGASKEIEMLLIGADGITYQKVRGISGLTLTYDFKDIPKGYPWILKMQVTPPSNPKIISGCKGRVRISYPEGIVPQVIVLQKTDNRVLRTYTGQKTTWWSGKSMADPKALYLPSRTNKFSGKNPPPLGSSVNVSKEVSTRIFNYVPVQNMPPKAPVTNGKKFNLSDVNKYFKVPVSDGTTLMSVPIGKGFYGSQLPASEYIKQLQAIEDGLNPLGYSLKDESTDTLNMKMNTESANIMQRQADSLIKRKEEIKTMQRLGTYKKIKSKNEIIQSFKNDIRTNEQELQKLSKKIKTIRNNNITTISDDLYTSNRSNGSSELYGDKNLFAVSFGIFQEFKGDLNKGMMVQDRGNVFIYIFNNQIEILGFSNTIYAPIDENKLSYSSKISIFNQDQKPINDKKLTSNTESFLPNDFFYTADVHYESGFSIGPFWVSIRAGARVVAGMDGKNMAMPMYASSNTSPYIAAKAYAEAGIGIYIVEVGVRCNLILLDLRIDFENKARIESDQFVYDYGIISSINALDGNIQVYLELDLFLYSKRWSWELFSWKGLTYEGGYIGENPGTYFCPLDSESENNCKRQLDPQYVGIKTKMHEWKPKGWYQWDELIGLSTTPWTGLTTFKDSIYYFRTITEKTYGDRIIYNKISNDALASDTLWEWKVDNQLSKLPSVPMANNVKPGNVMGACVYNDVLFLFYMIKNKNGLDSMLCFSTLDTEGKWTSRQLTSGGQKILPKSFTVAVSMKGVTIYYCQPNGMVIKLIGKDKVPQKAGELDWAMNWNTNLYADDIQLHIDAKTDEEYLVYKENGSKIIYLQHTPKIPILWNIKSIRTCYYDGDLYLFYIDEDNSVRYKMLSVKNRDWNKRLSIEKALSQVSTEGVNEQKFSGVINRDNSLSIPNSDKTKWINVCNNPFGIFLLNYNDEVGGAYPHWLNFRSTGVTLYRKTNYLDDEKLFFNKDTIFLNNLQSKEKFKSIKIPDGWSVSLHSNNNFSGYSIIISGNVPDLSLIVGDSFKAKSMTIKKHMGL